MNKIAITTIVLLGLGLLVYLLTRQPEPIVAIPTLSDKVQTLVETNGDNIIVTSNTEAGQYVQYRAEDVAVVEGRKILFFHAPWCPQCRALEASIQAGTIPAGVTIFKVDYDTNQALRQQYGVTIQTTLVEVDSQGSKLGSYVAYDEPTLASVITNLP